jgi:hypothetical protein
VLCDKIEVPMVNGANKNGGTADSPTSVLEDEVFLSVFFHLCCRSFTH